LFTCYHLSSIPTFLQSRVYLNPYPGPSPRYDLVKSRNERSLCLLSHTCSLRHKNSTSEGCFFFKKDLDGKSSKTLMLFFVGFWFTVEMADPRAASIVSVREGETLEGRCICFPDGGRAATTLKSPLRLLLFFRRSNRSSAFLASSNNNCNRFMSNLWLTRQSSVFW